jgi:hypothetical protein
MNGLGRQRLVALFSAGALLFNFPLLALWDRNALLFGVPLFPAALFIIWALLIGALGWLVENQSDGDAADAGPGSAQSPPATGPRQTDT